MLVSITMPALHRLQHLRMTALVFDFYFISTQDFKINPSFNNEGKAITQPQIIYLVFNGALPEQNDQELTSAGMQMLSNQITNIVTFQKYMKGDSGKN